MMKRHERLIIAAFAAFLAVIALLLIGRAGIRDDSQQADTAVRYGISEVQIATETAQTQDAAQEQSEEAGIIMRAYSDQEKERMKELQQSYRMRQYILKI